MAAGNAREALLRVADQLCAELGHAESEKNVPGAPRSPLGAGPGGMSGILSREDEVLVATMRRSLAKVAAAVGGARPDVTPQSAIHAALDGAEMVMRGELVRGNAEQLPSLMPSFVFLVTLPVVEQDKALDLSRRTSELIEGALGS